MRSDSVVRALKATGLVTAVLDGVQDIRGNYDRYGNRRPVKPFWMVSLTTAGRQAAAN
jgi:hypothetical protein